MSEDMEETNSGVKKKGEWEEVADFARDASKAMKESEVEDGSVEEFDEWRPREDEDEKDVKEKTVESAILHENSLEDTEGVKKDLRRASENVAEAVKEEEPARVADASRNAAKPFYARIATAFRKLEKIVYSQVSLRFNPYYLDTQDFSADMKKKRDGDYEMDINIPEEKPRDSFKDRIEEG